MSEQELRERLAKNLTEYRRLYEMTQAELAEKLNYSDKSVSKWERGEGLPDVYVLSRLAELYGVTTDDLLSDRTPRRSPALVQKRRRSRVLITSLSVGLVWLVAVLCFFFLGLFVPDLTRRWLTFLFATPPSFIVLIVFAALWGGQRHRVLAVSGLVWSIAACVAVPLAAVPNIYLIYIVAAVFQVLVILWFIMRRNAEKRAV